MRISLAWFAAAIALAGCTPAEHPRSAGTLPPGSKYVAMGSSYAAGAGIAPIVSEAPPRCGRSASNYPHLLATRLGLDLADVSCGGATTDHILGPWNELPPQIEAITPDTRLVTVTIGGNDVDFVRNLIIASSCKQGAALGGRACPKPTAPSEARWAALEQNLRQIAREASLRAPAARVVFVDYLRVFPKSAACTATPLSDDDLLLVRSIFDRLAKLTRKVAREENVGLLPAGELSERHDPCAAVPWANGFPATGAAWHPNAAGHAAVAEALARQLRTR